MMDLNDLKSCNDTMGHQAGDEYLCTCAAIIAKAFADYGTAYRIGGDEFVVVIEKPDSEKNAEHIKAMEKLESEHNGVEGAYPVGIAWDYAEYSRELDASYDDTISRADRNMYELKKDMKPHEEQIAKTSCAPNKRKGAAKK